MEKLCCQLREIFSEDHINTVEVRSVLSAYKSNPADWKKYAKFDPFKYTRNLVDEGNGKYNLIVLCWGPGMGSSVHDHTDAHCFVKILQGELTETRYNWPASEDEEAPLLECGSDTYHTNEVTYMSDQLGLHRMENLNHSDGCISLHLYIPPFKHCQVFDERTGHKTKSLVTFYTKYGNKVDYKGSKEGKLVMEEDVSSQ
uniref:Cysteine dioxygenase n=1 Tax=Steinernema glaseri TaxID=37863 RepID=A0A1I7YZ71_9BILA